MDNHRDVVLYVCGQAFVANRIAVSAASPYLGSVLAAAPSSTHVTLPPLVPPDVFSALMAGVGDMASLRRALTETNVEQILVGAQLLQMHEAAAECKDFVARMRNQPRQQHHSPTILKPIPSRPNFGAVGGEGLLAAAAAAAAAALAWRNAWAWSPLLRTTCQTPFTEALNRIGSPPSSSTTPTAAALYSPLASPLSLGDEAKPSPILCARLTVGGQNKDATTSEGRNHMEANSRKFAAIEPTPLSSSSESPPPKPHANLDVAACDGPVVFKRIPNPCLAKNFSLSTGIAGGASSDEAAKKSSSKSYKCLFCSHVFKSHYCYEKHKRRHIHPFAVDFEKEDDDIIIDDENNEDGVSSESSGPKQQTPLVARDANVQFFPCKSCGAKFPSYYFVHKHKKLWHADEVEAQSGIKDDQSLGVAAKME